jgi:hypothetical protein
MNKEARRELAGAFREITFGLMGLFELHDVEPQLAEDAGNMLARIYRARTRGANDARPGAARRLLKQLQHDQTAGKAA